MASFQIPAALNLLAAEAASMQCVERLRSARQWNSPSSTLACKGDLRMSTSALTDAIYQNTAGNSQGYPLGVPTSWSWYSGTDTLPGKTPPSNFSPVTVWGKCSPHAAAPPPSLPSPHLLISNFQSYLHL